MLHLAAQPASRPSWLVTDGQLVVGPVSTDLLLRGLIHQRVPGDALVKQPTWREWRKLREIREFAPISEDHLALDLLDEAKSFAESCHYALITAMSRTRAATGVVYRNAEPHIGMMATVEKGLAADLVLGVVLSPGDPVVRHATMGGVIVGSPRAGMLHRLVADRIGGSDALRGIMMLPVRWDGLLVAMIELGRFDHEFRSVDVGAAEELARGIAARVAKHFDELV